MATSPGRALPWSSLFTSEGCSGCPPCLRFSRAVRWLHRRLPAAQADVRLPPEARDRIARALEQANAASKAAEFGFAVRNQSTGPTHL